MMLVICLIWPSVLILSLPVLLYNRLVGPGIRYCVLKFPGNHIRYFVAFKYLEFVLFYLIPMVSQVACYSITGKHLFAGSEQLHRTQIIISQDGVQRERMSDALRARKGVVKMLIASVIIYFISYSPHQILLFYNTFAKAPFHSTWVFLVFVTAMGYINSAANPVLYCIFSQNFRQKFTKIFMSRCKEEERKVTKMHLTYTDSGMSTRYSRVPVRMTETDF